MPDKSDSSNQQVYMESFTPYFQTYLPAVEQELKYLVDRVQGPGLDFYHHMLAYHMGWVGEGAGAEARGKRIRPMLVLLTCEAAGGTWNQALPAAAAVELVHNFSLVHDDIQDNSPLRRGRTTVWKNWGIAQAINVGDGLFSLAQAAILELQKDVAASTVLRASRLVQEACMELTRGQFMDLTYEARGDLHLDAYWPMVAGKTAALLSACTGLGALIAGAQEPEFDAYRQFGRALGLAFQVLDDLLGIWGDTSVTGKSTASDLVSGKKSLPVLYGLGQQGAFADRWTAGPITVEEAPEIAVILAAEGARTYTQERAAELTSQALQALEKAQPRGLAGEALRSLADALLRRQV